ncbi:transporter substrate-binding domain-containing protein [Ochrobactrum tritici]|uniref:Transporter substrate-binding domain-containing protein n=1 Tax=Brucella tritici TaxID=94626 RepID=A0A7X6JBA7_9HYPH|nr:transporter substrate-binding domain-containing protein [Brucella tritici]
MAVIIGQRIADSLGAKVEIVELSWSGAIAAIQTGQVDLSLGLMAPRSVPLQSSSFIRRFINTASYSSGATICLPIAGLI